MLMLKWTRIQSKLTAVKLYQAIQKAADPLCMNKWDGKLGEGEKFSVEALIVVFNFQEEPT